MRADARRNLEAVLAAAKTVFVTSGVDAPAKEITDLAGVGVGTLYRHFPQRSDLIVAVLEQEIDAVAASAAELASQHEPAEALRRWFRGYTDLLATKPGFAKALHSGDPAFAALPGYFRERLGPALAGLLEAAGVRAAPAEDLLYAGAQLCSAVATRGRDYTDRMVAIFVDGLRYNME
jgi:AcrR family transcriptional regulator